MRLVCGCFHFPFFLSLNTVLWDTLTLNLLSFQLSLLSGWICVSKRQVLKKAVPLHLSILETKTKGEIRCFTTSAWKLWSSPRLLGGTQRSADPQAALWKEQARDTVGQLIHLAGNCLLWEFPWVISIAGQQSCSWIASSLNSSRSWSLATMTFAPPGLPSAAHLLWCCGACPSPGPDLPIMSLCTCAHSGCSLPQQHPVISS